MISALAGWRPRGKKKKAQYSCALCYQSKTKRFNEQSLNWVFAGSTKPTLLTSSSVSLTTRPAESRPDPFLLLDLELLTLCPLRSCWECGSGPLSIHHKAITLSSRIMITASLESPSSSCTFFKNKCFNLKPGMVDSGSYNEGVSVHSCVNGSNAPLVIV